MRIINQLAGGINMCTDDPSILKEKKIGDKIRFNYSDKEITFTITNVNHTAIAGHEGSLVETSRTIKIVSDITNAKGEPSLELTYIIDSISGHNTGKLTFIRQNTIYAFKNLVDIFLCVSKYVKAHEIMLDDDAKFVDATGENAYYALFYRLFEGKQSIYIYAGTGFKPMFTANYTEEMYNNDINLIKNSLLNDWMPLFEVGFEVSSYYRGFAQRVRTDIVLFGTKPMIEYLNYLRTLKITKDGREITGDYELLNCLFGIMSRKDIIERTRIKGTLTALHEKVRKIYNVANKLVSTDFECSVCKM